MTRAQLIPPNTVLTSTPPIARALYLDVLWSVMYRLNGDAVADRGHPAQARRAAQQYPGRR